MHVSHRLPHGLLIGTALWTGLWTGLTATAAAQGGATFEKTVKVLQRRFYDREFRKEKLPGIAARYRDAARATKTLEEERVVVHAMLKEIPASHLALYSRATHRGLLSQLFGNGRPGFGFSVTQRAGRFYADSVLDGGPAAEAGLRRGDRVLQMDGEFPGTSRRLDWRSDDAHLPDPPVHGVLVGERELLSLRVARGERVIELEIEAGSWGASRASKASVRIIERDGKRIGYVHLWMIFMGSSAFFSRTMRKDFADCDSVILDLRGRGGSAGEVKGIVATLRKHKERGGGPVFGIIDNEARSAKEVIAYELRENDLVTLVGQHTAGAVIPATFERVSKESVLMFPSFKLGSYTDKIEHIGVAPHVEVADAIVGDPILQRTLRLAMESGSR